MALAPGAALNSLQSTPHPPPLPPGARLGPCWQMETPAAPEGHSGTARASCSVVL